VAQYQVDSGLGSLDPRDTDVSDSISLQTQDTLVQEELVTTANTSIIKPGNNIVETAEFAERGPSPQASPTQAFNTKPHRQDEIDASTAITANVSHPQNSESLPFANMSLVEKYERLESFILVQERAAALELAKQHPPPEEKKKPIKFKDAIGRKFSFPFHLCCTWVVSC
jgi:hypothetical protein